MHAIIYTFHTPLAYNLQSLVQKIALDDLHSPIESTVDALLVPLRKDVISAGTRNALCDYL